MKLKTLFTATILLSAVLCYSQQQSCADSSVRIKYIFGNSGAALFNNPNTSGVNIFTGELSQSIPTGIALLKTTWGDSMIWAKKIIMQGTSRNSFTFPDGSILCTGFFGLPANSELLLCRINANGNVIWAKHYKLSQNHLNYQNVSFNSIKNIFITNNAIYFNAIFNFLPLQAYNYFNIIAKLDPNGNILWSNGLRVILPRIANVFDAPVFHNNEVIFGTNITKELGGGNTEGYITLTKLNDTDGSLIESNEYKIIPDALVKDIGATSLNINPDYNLSLTGFLSLQNIYSNLGAIVFNTRIDNNSIPFNNNYYTNNIPLSQSESYFSFNNEKQHAVLSHNSSNNYEKYFTIFGKNDEIIRTRKFIIPPGSVSVYRTSVNLDDKQNLHFIYHYPQSGKQVTEYARISNFAPDGTLGCFGKDTSILTQYPFTITKQPFTWDNIQSNVIVSNDVLYTEDTAIVTKELVCKIVSYCDSVHINGPATACIGQPVRYTVSKNNDCFKNSDWQIDTAFATIVNTEGDSAITIRFTKAFAGYIRAIISDCVVRDSLFVTVLPSPIIKITNRDSLLCPGKTIILKAAQGFVAYQWQDGSTADTLQVTTPGFYKVTGTDNCGFKTADSVVINNSDTALAIPATQTVCLSDTASIIFPNDVNNILWQPTTNTLLINKTLLLFPRQTTVYNITAERLVNCPITKSSTVVIKNCPREVFIPNAFTPNNDSNNDTFRASTFGVLQFYQLIIYNRYGQKLFETSNISTGWDGTFKGSAQPMGGYTYLCRYRFAGGLQTSEAGYFILVR